MDEILNSIMYKPNTNYALPPIVSNGIADYSCNNYIANTILDSSNYNRCQDC